MNDSESSTDKPLYRFGIVADVQGADKDDNKSRFYRASNTKFQICIDEWNKDSELSFGVQLGDIIDGNVTPESSSKDMDDVVEIVKQSVHPLYHVIGNHCLRYPGGKPKVMEKLEMKDQAYYVFEPEIQAVKDAKHVFIVLDGTDISINSWDPTDPKSILAQEWLDTHPIEQYPNSVSWNGSISDEQLAWFEERLKSARLHGQLVFVFCHYPIFADHPEMRVNLLWNHQEVCDLLDQYSDVVIAWFAGHYHNGGSLLPTTNRKWAHIVVEAILTAPEQSYGIVSVYRDRIVMEGIGSCRPRAWDIRVGTDRTD